MNISNLFVGINDEKVFAKTIRYYKLSFVQLYQMNRL